MSDAVDRWLDDSEPGPAGRAHEPAQAIWREIDSLAARNHGVGLLEYRRRLREANRLRRLRGVRP